MSDRGFLEAARSLFSTTDAVTKTKTVTFGDAAAVRSNTRWSVGALFVLLLLWWIVKLGGEDAILNDRTFPSQVDTWNAFIELIRDGFRDVSLWEHTRTSLWRITQGMFWGIVIGVPIGFAMGLSSRARGFFDTPVELFRPIPPLALLPLFILWFGIGDATARNLLIFASIWIMIIAARAGVRTVNLSKVRAAYSLGATKAQILRKVILPNALPEIFTGIRVALGVSWGTLVAAELVGTSTGLGAMIFAARPFFRIDIIVVGVVIISTIGVLMD
ncbi:MAG: ABC transporter permease, partial [Acidimicrobiia bacterium]|nr:ABC transporter permease [Acidimicrobiia bacterium]